MESFGIPCEHIVRLLVLLDICQFPDSIVLHRWTKNAKQGMYDSLTQTSNSLRFMKLGCLMDWFRQVAAKGIEKSNRYIQARDWAVATIKSWDDEDTTDAEGGQANGSLPEDLPANPPICMTKGRSGPRSQRASQRCRLCRKEGHNRTTCPERSQHENRDGHINAQEAVEENVGDIVNLAANA
ncbi:hypothetical protein PIB30_074746 [Stylosanthes scabra]|uniref:Protein FAR1-RELATED SEQUENCE n=1 Tax=Stylosanthes scabra TaxID=79078 RepID=A0ABU6TPF0_9FABA|nr:hypothetical protein [Stylosanthes scabra]